MSGQDGDTAALNRVTVGPKHLPIPALLLTPLAITRANLDVVLAADWVTRAALCKGVPAGKLAVCG